MASSPSGPPPFAQSPFDNPRGDIVLRSSDSLDFRVSKFILEVSSDSGIRAFGAHSEERRDGCPVISMSEDSKTLECLLRIIYPRKTPALDDLSKLHPLLAAALKYRVQEAIRLANATLCSLTPKEPLRVWAIAVGCQLEEEARAAAQEMVRQHISVLDSFPPEMEAIKAGAYYRLLRYRRLEGKVDSEKGFRFCADPHMAQPDPSIASTVADSQVISQSHSRIRSLADIICRSSDGQEFPAHKALLTLASPVIGTMIASLPGAALPADDSAERVDELPVLTFEEDGATLKIILTLCYPAPVAPEDTTATAAGLLVLQNALSAAPRYGLEDSEAMKHAQRQWSRLSASNPLRAYILAAAHGLDTQAAARQAARQLLGQSLVRYYDPILETTPALDYRNVLLYHKRCQDVIQQHIDAFIQQLPRKLGKVKKMSRVYHGLADADLNRILRSLTTKLFSLPSDEMEINGSIQQYIRSELCKQSEVDEIMDSTRKLRDTSLEAVEEVYRNCIGASPTI